MYIKHAYKEPKANFFLIVMEGERTDEIVSKSKILYQNVWVVFDKDDFEDFDDAIFEINELGEGKYQKNYEDIYELILLRLLKIAVIMVKKTGFFKVFHNKNCDL